MFVFKSGKSIQGEIRFEDNATIRILEKSGLEMTLRKSELNLSATASANQKMAPVLVVEAESVVPAAKPEQQKRSARVYTNGDVRIDAEPFVASQLPETEQTWQKSVAKLERDLIRLQGSCRGAGTGPNLRKILRSHTYMVNGQPVRVTGYWADPASIDEAKQICGRAIATEANLKQARRGYRDYLERQKNQHNSLTAQ